MFNKYFGGKKLVCFDFDGLLVSTEPLHHLAYMTTLSDLGFPLELDFNAYCALAHSDDRDLFEKTVRNKYPHFPISWKELRVKKTDQYRTLLKLGTVKAMDGAEELVKTLQDQGVQTCIVTNSDRCDVETISEYLHFLKSIPLWITREDYALPKPAPDGYLMAVDKHGVTTQETIGLEDTIKGISSLDAAGIDSILVNKTPSANIKALTDLLTNTINV